MDTIDARWWRVCWEWWPQGEGLAALLPPVGEGVRVVAWTIRHATPNMTVNAVRARLA